MLLLALDTKSFPLESCSRVKCVFQEFVKHPKVLAVESKQYAHTNMFGVINALGTLQYGRLKNNHPLRVTLLSSYTAYLH